MDMDQDIAHNSHNITNAFLCADLIVKSDLEDKLRKVQRDFFYEHLYMVTFVKLALTTS